MDPRHPCEAGGHYWWRVHRTGNGRESGPPRWYPKGLPSEKKGQRNLVQLRCTRRKIEQHEPPNDLTVPDEVAERCLPSNTMRSGAGRIFRLPRLGGFPGGSCVSDPAEEEPGHIVLDCEGSWRPRRAILRLAFGKPAGNRRIQRRSFLPAELNFWLRHVKALWLECPARTTADDNCLSIAPSGRSPSINPLD